VSELKALEPLFQNALGTMIAIAGLITLTARISPLARYLKKHLFREIREETAAAREESRETRMIVLRVEIMLEATPWEVKLRLYDEYKRLGGNSHLDAWMVRYAKERGWDFVSRSGDILE
jgi:hypothetical protein